jgi:hypothetical protein
MMAVNKTSKGNQIMTTSDQTETKNKLSVISSVTLVLMGSFTGGFLSLLILIFLAQPEKTIESGEESFLIISMLLFPFLGWAIFQIIVQLISKTMSFVARYFIAVFGFLFSFILYAFLAINSGFLVVFSPILAVLTITAKVFKAKFTEKMPGWIEKALDIFMPWAIASTAASVYAWGLKNFLSIELINIFKP